MKEEVCLKRKLVEEAFKSGNIDFKRMDQFESDLFRANITKRKVVEAFLEAGIRNFRGMYLRGADLSAMDLEGADFQSANLEDANLEDANLEGANLKGTNLSYANMSGAITSGANIEEAIFKELFLIGTLTKLENGEFGITWRTEYLESQRAE